MRGSSIEFLAFPLTLLIVVSLVFSENKFPANALFEGNCSGVLEDETILDDCSLCSCKRNLRVSNFLNTECVITDDLLIHLMSLLQDAWSIITGTFSAGGRRNQYDRGTSIQETNCTEMGALRRRDFWTDNQVHTTACEEIISDIETLILDITDQIRRLVAWLDDPGNFDPRIVQLEECLRCVNKKLDDTIAEYDDRLGNFTQKFGEMQQCFTNSILEKKKEMEALELKLVQKGFKLVSSSVNASNYPDAISEFINLNNNTILDTLAFNLYGVEKLDNLLTFAYLLPQPEQRTQLYTKILELMQPLGHHLTMRVLSFNKVIYDEVKRLCGPTEVAYCTTLPDGFRGVLMLSDAFTNNTKISLTNSVCDNKHIDVLKVGSPETSVNLAGKAFEMVLPEIVTSAYSRCRYDLHIIINFLTSLRWNRQKPIGFGALLGVATDPKEKLLIALKMKEAMENLRGPDGNVEDAEDKMFKLKEALPHHVKNIVWHKHCNIKSDSNYLFTEKSHLPGNNRVHIRDINSTTALWVFHPIYKGNGSEVQFRIQRHDNDGSLGTHIPWRDWDWYWGFAAVCTPDDGEHPTRHYNWEIHFSSDSRTFSLWHAGRQAYLLPSENKDDNWTYADLKLDDDKYSHDNDWYLDCFSP